MLEILLGAGALVLALAIGYAFWRQGTTNAAIATIDILKTQVEALSADVTSLREENAHLKETVTVLQGMVTQTAPVHELSEYVRAAAEARREDHHALLSALARIEARLGLPTI